MELSLVGVELPVAAVRVDLDGPAAVHDLGNKRGGGGNSVKFNKNKKTKI